MSKKNIRIKIPWGKPDALLALAEKVETQYLNGGDKNAMGNIDMETFIATLERARETRYAAIKMHASAKAMMQESLSLLGIDKGQTKRDFGTIYQLLTMIRDQLLVSFFNHEEKLTEYGFKPVISTSTPRRHKQ